MILSAPCNTRIAGATQNMSTKAVDNLADNFVAFEIFPCFLVASMVCRKFKQFFKALNRQDIFLQFGQSIGIFTDLKRIHDSARDRCIDQAASRRPDLSLKSLNVLGLPNQVLSAVHA